MPMYKCKCVLFIVEGFFLLICVAFVYCKTVFEDYGNCTHHTAILINSGRLMLLPWSFLISVWLFVKTIGEKVLLSMISLCPKGRCIEQVLKTDIWVDFMFIVILLYPVSITSLNHKQPHVLSFGSCIVDGRLLGTIWKQDLRVCRKATSYSAWNLNFWFHVLHYHPDWDCTAISNGITYY